MDKLRTCNIKIETRYVYRICAGLRFLEKTIPEENHRAKFHRWTDENSTIKDYPETKVSAIVEYEDGTVHKVPPECITFTDSEV